MGFLQKLYRIILYPIYKITGKINETARNTMITLSCIGLVGFFIIYFTTTFKKLLKWHLTFDTIICSIMLFCIIVFSGKDQLKPIKWNKLVSYLFFIAGAGVVAISCIHPIGSGYRAWGLLMMFGFPCLYYVWNNREDYNELYKRLAAATVLVGIIYYAFCFYKASKGEVSHVYSRVEGTFYDSNMFSMIGMIMLSSSAYMLLVNRNSIFWFLFTVAGFGIGIDITWLGASRLAMLSVLGSLLAFSIYYFKIQKDFTASKKRITKFLRAEALLISVIIFIFAGKYMMTLNQNAFEEKATIKTASISNDMVVTEQFVKEIDTSDNPIDRFVPDGRDLDAYTAGRYSIWKGYAQFLNMTGNDFSKADWKALTGNKVKHAHNNFLEIAYRCGIPVACLHLLLELIAGIICIIYLFSKRFRDPAYLFSIVFMITYAIQSMFDIATIPFERPAPFYFYMAMIPIFMFKRKKINEDEETRNKNCITEAVE